MGRLLSSPAGSRGRSSGTRKLRDWAAEAAGVPSWLFDECYDAVGDLSETIALLLPPPDRTLDLPLARLVEEVLLPLREQEESAQKAAILDVWRGMDQGQRFVWNKLISGAFRVGVSAQLVTRALAKVSGVESAVVAHRLMGDWRPTPGFFDRLRATESGDAERSRPYPVLPGLSAGGRARDRSGPRRIGRSSGNGTASGRRSSAARARSSSGRAARSSSPTATPNSPRSRTPCPMGLCSTARSSPGRTAVPCPSPSCRGGSAGSLSARRS